jgi:hypothetical protein
LLALVAAASVLLASAPCRAELIQLPTTLDKLLADGAFVQVDDKQFENFDFRPAGFNGPVPDASLIQISAISSPQDNPGLFFQSPQLLVVGNQAMDVQLAFDVTALDPKWKIKDVSLKFTAAQAGNGTAAVAEVASTSDNHALASELVYVSPNGQDFSEGSEFAPQRTIRIRKDIGLVANGGAAYISDFTQNFSQVLVPEPSSLLALSIGAVCAALFAWRRPRQNA